jgi:hypothetical protein
VARLITHERPLDGAVDAIAHAMANPDEVMKLVVHVTVPRSRTT